MRTIPSLRLLFAAVCDHLEDAGLSVGRGSAEGLTLPYVVVTPMPSGQQDGSLSDPYATEPYTVQVSAWGTTVEQATWGADASRQALFDGAIAPPSGWRVMHVAEDVGNGLTRDDDTAGPAIYQAVNRYRLTVTPT